MSQDKSKQKASSGKTSKRSDTVSAPAILTDVSRRTLLAGAALGSLTAASLGLPALAHNKGKPHGGPPPHHGHHKKQKILLKNCYAILTMDPNADMAGADILIQDGKILAIGKHLPRGDKTVDCSTLIAVPGFITTHHHKYETPQRSANADGYIVFGGPGGFAGPADPEQQRAQWPYESYSNMQNLWNQGRMVDIDNNVWDLEMPSQAPEDLYLSHLVASLAELKAGITCATDTSQSSHTPAHTDAMIKGLMDSGQRNLYAYTGGIDRAGPGHATDPNGYEYPGAIGEDSWGVGRLRKEWFPSDDQLVTLCIQTSQAEVTNAQTGNLEGYSGWELAKHYGTWIDAHNIANPTFLDDPLINDPEIGPKMTHIHCVRWGSVDAPGAQVGANNTGYPNPGNVSAWQKAYEKGVHVSIAVSIEMQMRHGRPPIQECLNNGIMPSLSPDVDCNKNGADPFTLMRAFFDMQRLLSSELAFPVSDPGPLLAPQSVTCYQTLQVATMAGAAGSGLAGKVGMLKPGYDADIVLLETNDIRIAPANNAPGTVVTMMDTSNVRHVMVQGEFKVWDYELVGWNVEKLIRDINRSRDKIIERINSKPLVLAGKNTPINPYAPPLLGSCCYVGQNEMAPDYNLRP